MEYPFTNQLLYIKRSVINVLLRNANCEPFKIPVNAELLGVPQYPKLIKSPMDFGTIKTKLDKRAYQTANECKSDFQDIFRNCYIFNEPGSLYVEMALKLENLFKRKMAELPMPEIYVPESALQTPKLNKVKKSKLPLNISTPIIAKHKPIGVTPINSSLKTDNGQFRKRSRSNSGNGIKDEPVTKKTKSAIDMKTCKNIIQSLMSKNYHDWNRYFLEAVDVEGLKLHDYYTIVKKPMDLGSIKSKLLEGRYQSNVEFSEDIKLIFKNCYLYNPEGHEVRRCGKLLEGIFIKLYQSSFPKTKPQHVTKPARVPTNYTEFQPQLQKILKRQTEIDVLNSDIVKRNQEIQNSLEYLKNTEFIKSYNINFNSSKKVTSTATVKKPSTKPAEPLKQELIKPPPSSSIIGRNNSPRTSVIPKSFNRDARNDTSEPSGIVEPMADSHADQPSQRVPKCDNSHDNHRASLKAAVSSEDNPSHQKTHSKANPDSVGVNPAVSHNHAPKNIPQKEAIITKEETAVKEAKNTEQFNVRLKEIKEWISGQSEVEREQIKDFINQSERRSVVQVNLLKLKPSTINGLYTMMKEANNIVAAVSLRDFTNEDRMQLNHDLSDFSDKYSDKILRIYKKTENVDARDGECELDFQKMKLVTLHRLREFVNKRRDKVKKSSNPKHPVDENGDDSDSDSSDSSDSDSNSDASSNSSSDADFFNNLPRMLGAEDINKETVTVIAPSSSPPLNDYASPVTQSSQSLAPLSNKPVASNSPLQTRLSDSSDSEMDDDDDDDDGNNVRRHENGGGSKRPRHSTLWNKHPTTTTTDVRSPAFVQHQRPKQPPVPVQHLMYNHSTRSQLDESLRQIVQDAQAHENVKKQEEELRVTRMREEEEQKRQHLLKIQAMNESRKKLHNNEQLKKDQEITRLRERASADQSQRNIDIPEAVEREDYHQLLCDFEYNISHNVIARLVNSERHQVHL